MAELLRGASAIVAGRYQIIREVGRGATAIVYLGRDVDRDRLVAVKVLREELTSAVAADRFLREIRISARLQHPHIAPLLDSGIDDGSLFLVLPYIAGGTLRDCLTKERQLPIDQAIAITRSIAMALDYAHAEGFVHRDVKPENILLSPDGACLVDFGIARAFEHAANDATTSGLVRGTPAYMSPEQAGGERDLDGRSDVFSLGCVLYEMLAGVPAYLGPTPQSVVAQRFVHAPRDVRVYRPSVLPALITVLSRALAIERVDRFATAKDFADALSRASKDLSTTEPWAINRTTRRLLWMAAVTLVALGGSTYAVLRGHGQAASNALANADTTTLLILPLRVARAIDPDGVHAALLEEAFARWQGVTLVNPFQIADALSRLTDTAMGDMTARRLASRLGAGRVVRAGATRVDDSLHVVAALYDVGTGRLLAQSTTHVSLNGRGAADRYALVADTLLLRGVPRSGASHVALTSGTPSLPAAQAFQAAMSALGGWDLSRADSLLAASVGYDAQFVRGALWLAQVRAWNQRDPSSWRGLAELVVRRRAGLSASEERLGAALVALAHGKYDAACAEYAELRRQNENDFAAWYGLGQCHDIDAVVVRDSASASGWRFRSSYHAAVVAYARAFELLPSTYRSFQQSAFSRLRELLFTSATQLRLGVPEPPDTAQLWGVPTWRGDSLILVPWPAAVLAGVGQGIDRDGRRLAVDHQRIVFKNIASGWAAALPQSAGAKEAVAVSLAMLGDPSALDTLAVARQLASDRPQRMNLAMLEVVTRVRLTPMSETEVARARALADSMLAVSGPITADEARALAPLAVLTGRCNRASELIRMAAPSIDSPDDIPRQVMADIDAMVAQLAAGCTSAGASNVDLVAAKLRSIDLGARRLIYEQSLFGQPARLAFPYNAAWIHRLARETNDVLLRAQAGFLHGDTAVARQLLGRIHEVRSTLRPGEWTADAALPEARLWLALHDTTTARVWLDQFLDGVRWAPPLSADELTVNILAAGCLVQNMALRAELATSAKDDSSYALGAAVLRLWSNADAPIQPLVALLRRRGP